ncbi:MAG: DJ-1/PfpI family protein [Gemmatimonadota bacterium]|nr:DJ-1/PfpI family protein [Gemmatimonadota bacterium]
MSRRNVAILLFPEVEVLDFAGPFEVFSRTRLDPGVESRRSEETAPFRVYTVARTGEPITATGGLRVIPHFDFNEAPSPDILVIPGGFGTRALLEDDGMLAWLRRAAGGVELLTSVCTGSLVLARAGLLAGRRATTHWGAHDLLEAIDPSISVDRESRVVDDGVVTSAGVSAGMDMAFHVVERFCGKDVADETGRYIEYPRLPGAGLPAGGPGRAPTGR